jgi:CubicO group peptidase (beta-lactamase class C family)
MGLAAPVALGGVARSADAALAPTINYRQDQHIAGLVAEYMKQYGVPGLTLAYGRGADVLLARAYGLADRVTNEPVRVDSLFRIASVSKSLTSAAIFALVEKGRLALGDRVFAPDGILHAYARAAERADWVHAITIHDLLTHTAGGWPNDETDPMFGDRDLDAPELIEHTLATRAPRFPPGEHYEYSNFGYCILGRAIEMAAGMPYDAYVRRRILDAVGITDMRIATKEPVAREVHYYRASGEDPYALPITRMDSHGGWIATPSDLVRYATALFGGGDRRGAKPLLPAPLLATIRTGTHANPAYGCGWNLTDAGNVWHTGHLPGSQALLVHAKDGIAWAVIINTRDKRVPAMTTAMDKLMWQIRHGVAQWNG